MKACAASLALAALLAACGSVAPARFHTLLAAGAPSFEQQRTITWELLPIAIPAQVDRPQWVVRGGDGTLAVLENERWIAPLGAEMHGAIGERLAETIGASRTSAKPWRVRIDVQRFDSLPGRAARIEADWSVSGASASFDCRASYEDAAAAGFPALAAAHRGAVRRLADAIAAALVALDAGRAATCR